MKKYIISTWLLISIFVGSECFATNWYVDNAATGANAGTSWTNAWTSFARIVWGGAGVKAGDTLFISGGSTSKTYRSRLVVGASGSAGNYIKIQIGQDAGHNGKVIITDTTESLYGIGISSKSYIWISGQVGSGSDKKIQLTGNQYCGLYISGTSDYLIVEYMEIDNNDVGAYDSEGGITMGMNGNPTDIELRYLSVHDNYQDAFHIMQNTTFAAVAYDRIKIHDSDIYNTHDDSMEAAIGGISIYNNTFHDRIPPYRGHPDMLQLYNNYYKIYNNTFSNHYGNTPEGGGPGQIMVIYFNPDGDNNLDMNWNPHDVMIYNNVFLEPNAYQANTLYITEISLAFSDPDWTDVSNIYVYNNTFTSGGSANKAIGLTFTGSPDHAAVHDVYIENNIFSGASYTTSAITLDRGAGSDITYGSQGDSVDVVFDYNTYYGQGSAKIYYGSSELTYTAFLTTTGAQDHGLTSNPVLDGNYGLTVGSPAINAGLDLSAFFTTDKSGTTRPQGSAWDMGAYEYKSGPSIPMPPTNLRIK